MFLVVSGKPLPLPGAAAQHQNSQPCLLLPPADDPKKAVLGRRVGRLYEFHVDSQGSGATINRVVVEAAQPGLPFCHCDDPAIFLEFDALIQFPFYQLGEWRVVPRPPPAKPGRGGRTWVAVLLTS